MFSGGWRPPPGTLAGGDPSHVFPCMTPPMFSHVCMMSPVTPPPRLSPPLPASPRCRDYGPIFFFTHEHNMSATATPRAATAGTTSLTAAGAAGKDAGRGQAGMLDVVYFARRSVSQAGSLSVQQAVHKISWHCTAVLMVLYCRYYGNVLHMMWYDTAYYDAVLQILWCYTADTVVLYIYTADIMVLYCRYYSAVLQILRCSTADTTVLCIL